MRAIQDTASTRRYTKPHFADNPLSYWLDPSRATESVVTARVEALDGAPIAPISTFLGTALGCLHAHTQRPHRSMEVRVGKSRRRPHRRALHSRRDSPKRAHRQ